jgi:6,7-dimethyl-8-ribityllumazine synthase
MMKNLLLSLLALSPLAAAFAPAPQTFRASSAIKGVDGEVSFGDLDGSDVRVGIIRTRWNSDHVTALVKNCRASLKECQVEDENIFETEVPGAFELPLAARFLALSGTVDAIVCAGVLIKGETLHFEYISETVASGLMSVGLNTQTPVVYGVLNCLNDDQVEKRLSHGADWAKTAVEMALLRNEALAIKKSGGSKANLSSLGFEKATPLDKKQAPGFF